MYLILISEFQNILLFHSIMNSLNDYLFLSFILEEQYSVTRQKACRTDSQLFYEIVNSKILNTKQNGVKFFNFSELCFDMSTLLRYQKKLSFKED